MPVGIMADGILFSVVIWRDSSQMNSTWYSYLIVNKEDKYSFSCSRKVDAAAMRPLVTWVLKILISLSVWLCDIVIQIKNTCHSI